MSEDAKKPFRVLSLDGGGAKGFYTIGILSEIEAMTGRLICDSFDLIFGTSTGAIIAALLARGEKVETVRSLYEQHVPTIMKASNTAKRTAALHHLAKEVFGDQRADIFKTGIGIVVTNWNDEMPMIFKASVNQAHGSKGSFEPFFGALVADAIIGSCSAYPFFNRHVIKKGNGDVVEVADGGFRATASTILNEHGFEPSVIERQLAHAERNEVRAAYNHAQYLPERRKMMQWWADYIDEAASKPVSSN